MTDSFRYRMDRRRFLHSATLTLGALMSADVLAACGATESSAASAQQIHFLGQDQPETIASVISGFEAANPGVKIQYESVPFDQINDVVQNRIGSRDTSLDVYEVDQPRTAALVHRHFLPDLAALKTDTQKDVLASSIAGSSVNDVLYGMPTSTSSQLLYYNIDLLQKANIPLPSINPAHRLTWEEVVAAGKQAQQAGARWGVMFEQISRYYQLQPLFASARGGSGLTGKDLLTVDITNPGWIKAATFYRDLFVEQVGPRGVDANQTAPLFSNGQLAFIIGGPWLIATFEESKDLHYGVAPHPYFADGVAATPTGSWSLGLNPYSTKKDLALKFIRYAGLDSQGAHLMNGPGGMPANSQALDRYLSTLQTSGAHLQGVSSLLEYELKNTTVLRPPTIGYIQFEVVMNETLEDIRNGVDPRTRLQSATEELNGVFSRL